jgi:hypothetical protein
MKTTQTQDVSPKSLRPPVGSMATPSADVLPAVKTLRMTCTEHNLSEWYRLATAAHRDGHSAVGDVFSVASGHDAGYRMPIGEFDALQSVYCGWLALGWSRALELFARHFPASPSPAAPTKPVCTTYEPFDAECPALCKHCGGSEAQHTAPCPSASHLPLVPPVGVSGAKLHRRAPARRAPAPVSPSLPASVESEALDLLLDGMAKLDLVRKVKSLKADVERLTGALKAVLEIADAPKLHGAETAATISNLVRLSLAEVGKH